MAKKTGTKVPESENAVALNEGDLEQTAAAGKSPLIKKTLKAGGTTKTIFHGSDFNAVKSGG